MNNRKKLIKSLKFLGLFYSLVAVIVIILLKQPSEYIKSILYELRPIVLMYLIYILNKDYFNGVKK